MATFFAIQTQLALIKSQLIQLSEFSAGRPESDDDADKDSTTLDRIDQQLCFRDTFGDWHCSLTGSRLASTGVAGQRAPR